MNILVLTTRNIYGNSGEYSLMSAKDKVLKKKGVNLYYYSFRRKFDMQIPEELNIVEQDSTFSLLYNKQNIINKIINLIEKYNVKIVVLSGGWIFILHEELKKLKKAYDIKYSFDYQGAIEEIVEYKRVKNSEFLSKILYRILKKYETKAINMADGIEVVSKNCIKHIEKTYNIGRKIQKVIVHCGIENPISKNEYKIYRKQWRKYFNFKNGDIACVYAGGIAPWQNIDKIIDKARENRNIKLFFFTSLKNQKILRKKYTISDNIYFGFLSHEELGKAMCAFDYGFLLRNSDITNYVAFPNKYSDYINARLKIVVMSTSIGCYPEENQRKSIIVNVDTNFFDKKRRDKYQDNIYQEYINDLSYDYMVDRFLRYYDKICKVKADS